MLCSGLNVSTAESGLESHPFFVTSLYSRDFLKEETANDDFELCLLLGGRGLAVPKGPSQDKDCMP